MPRKIFCQVQLPHIQPDCCQECPLLGLRPKSELEVGERQTHVCLAFIQEPDPQNKYISGRKTRSRKSDHDTKNHLHRFCDRYWDMWVNGGMCGRYPITDEIHIRYRLPMIENLQLQIKFKK